MNKSLFKFISSIILLLSISFANNQFGISYQLKFGNDKIDSTNFYENYFDVNYFFNNGLYLFSQFEYSNPPLLGNEIEDISDIVNIFYLQYSGNKYSFTLGSLYLLYGRGLSMHTYQDQGVDYDNSIIGIESTFNVKDNLDLSFAFGTNNFKSRINSAENLPSLSIDNNLFSFNSEWYFDNINFHYLGMVYSQKYDYRDIVSMMNLSSILGEYLYTREDYILNEKPNDEMTNLEHNFGLDFNLGRFDFYLEKSIVFYDKLLSGREKGSREYFSTYFNINDLNIFFEYKNYYTPYFYSVFSTPPICFRESSSVLLSRNIHTIDFNNEYGYQLEIIQNFNSSLNFMISHAFAFKYNNVLSEPSLFEASKYLFNNDKINSLYSDFYPFKQLYFELSGWVFEDRFFYKVGYDHFYEITDIKTINAKTIPMQYAYNFKYGNSLTFYLEFQDQDKIENNLKINYDYVYFSPSYNHYGKWLVTFFLDKEDSNKKWMGIDFTYNLINSSQISFFYGSQKGGLVCANGSCVKQPDFEDGFKLTYLISI